MLNREQVESVLEEIAVVAEELRHAVECQKVGKAEEAEDFVRSAMVSWRNSGDLAGWDSEE